MRLKTYAAPTIAEAMDMVRRELGEDAIIVSTQKAAGEGGARVTAALELQPVEDIHFEAEREPVDVPEAIRHALSFHGTPHPIADRLIRLARDLQTDDPVLALAGALDAAFTFRPLPEPASPQARDEPIMLIGPPGTGKSLTIAKLAARAALAGRRVDMVTTDIHRAGAVAQLEAFTRILEIDLAVARSPDNLRVLMGAAKAPGGLLIDTPATNPFSDAEMDYLDGLIRAAGVHPVLVLAAGGDALEAAEIAAAFADVGARRLLVTRLDMARRLGSLLSAAHAGHLHFCDVSVTPHVADGLSPINPVSLARLIMPHADDTQRPRAYPSEAA